MFRFASHKILSLVSPTDFRTAALFLACMLAFYMGIRFEMVDTAKVQKQFAEYKLSQSVELTRVQQQVLEEAVAAQVAIQEINENAQVREAQLLADNRSLAARVRDERLRREALAKQVPKTNPAGATTQCDAGGSGPSLYGQAGEDIVSLIWEADVVRSSLLDCQAYVREVQRVFGP